MTGPIQLGRRAAICGAFLWVLQTSGAVLAGPCLPHPCGSRCVCAANVQGFGYFHTQWRQWPNEPRPDIRFPQSIGADVLPTPAGEKQAPLSPPGGLFPGEPPAVEGLLPPEGGLRLETEPPFGAEPPVPGESLPELPKEKPAELPKETPAEPQPEMPGDAPPQTSRETDVPGPLVQSSWAAPTEELRETAPLLQPSWLAGLPARSARHVNSPSKGEQPDAGHSAPLETPAENLGPETPVIGTESPERASRPPATTLRTESDEEANGQDRDTSHGAPAKAPQDTAMLSPLLQSGWAALAEEPRGMPPLVRPGWFGRLSADATRHAQVPATQRQPERSGSIPSKIPAGNLQPEIPSAAKGLPKSSPEPLSGESASRGESHVLETSGNRPSDRFDIQYTPPAGPFGRGFSSAPDGGVGHQNALPMGRREEFQSRTLQANWNAALHPGLRGEVDRATGRYPSVERATAVVHQSPVVPSLGHEDVPPNGPPATPALRKQPSDQPGRQPTDRSRDTEEVGRPPVALDGYCAVELGEKERWLPGNPRWSVVHQGQTYLFSGPAQRQRFLANPRRYVPAYSAHDPVLAVDRNLRVPGHTDYCVMYDGQLYMFSGSVTLARFQENPGRYTAGGRK